MAIQTLESAQKNKYNYVAISRSGKIYLPENFSWHRWGYHAGPSKCPETGRSGVSQYYGGIEVNNPGKLYHDAANGVLVPWFNNRNYRKRGQPPRIKSTKDEHYQLNEAREITARTGNIEPGWYVPYTREQFEALVSAILYAFKQNERTFNLSYVFGHDEVSPGRKNDPGGALGYPGKLFHDGRIPRLPSGGLGRRRGPNGGSRRTGAGFFI